MVQENYPVFNVCYNSSMAEKGVGLYSDESHPHTGDPRVDPRARAPHIGRRGITGPGLLDSIPEQNSVVDQVFSQDQGGNNPPISRAKERRRRIHPYNIPKGTATWSGPYGKDGTIRLDDVPVDVVAYPVYKKAYSGALTMMVEVDSPPEFKGMRFQIAKPLKEKGWYR